MSTINQNEPFHFVETKKKQLDSCFFLSVIPPAF